MLWLILLIVAAFVVGGTVIGIIYASNLDDIAKSEARAKESEAKASVAKSKTESVKAVEGTKKVQARNETVQSLNPINALAGLVRSFTGKK